MLAAILSLTLLAEARLVRADSSSAVGDYVAAGLGISSSAPGTQPVATGLVTVDGTVFTATKLANGDIEVANTTVHPSSTTNSTAAAATGLSSPTDCYASWQQYWTASRASLLSNYSYTPSSTPVTTFTSTNEEAFSAQPLTTSTYITTIDTEIPIVNGGFTISTQTILSTSSYVYTQSSEPASTSTWTWTYTSYATVAPNATVSVPPKPTCTLPSVVPDCQSSWENWITTQLIPSPTPPPHCDIDAGFLNNQNTVPPCATSYSSVVSAYSVSIGTSAQSKPVCTVASISSSLCQSVRDNYQMDENYIFQPSNDAFFFNQGTLGNYNGLSTSWYWPTSSTLGSALGCTLGCGRCAVTGGTVQLIYWPEATPTPAAGSGGSPASAAPQPTAPVTVETLGTTFTSPTLYISYQSLYAENACGTTGTVISNTILAIPTDQPLSSVYAGTIPCDAHFRPTQVWTGTAPFTVQDLPSPAYSIYSSQPWCQTYVRNHGCGNVTCPTTYAYKPILVVPTPLLQSMQPAWSSCWGDIRGVYDPPIALTQVSSAKGPSVPYGPTHTSDTSKPTSEPATPASGPAATTPTPTGVPDNLPTTTDGDGPTIPHVSSDVPQSTVNIGGQLTSVLGGEPGQSQPAPDSYPNTVATVGSQAYTVSQISGSSGAVVVAQGGNTQTINAGADPITIGNQVASIASNGGLVIGTGSSAATLDPGIAAPRQTVATIGSQTFTLSALGGTSGVVAVNDDTTTTLAAGTNVGTLGGHVVSIGSSGFVAFGTGSSATTIDLSQETAAPGVEVAQIGSETYTFSDLPGTSGVVIIDAGKTTTLTAGGSAMTIGTQVVSIASSGRVVLGTGSTATTIGVTTTSSSASSGMTSSSTSRASSSTTAEPSSMNTGAASRTLVSSGACFAALVFGVLAL
ncbi:hypothetical protein HII31_00418 [Pseudocercospora fuligena]|uniref:Uncharacterized protein n=1 Tax=Pseudocercospora fuligena TaxID=685502 RepID=A0A8H6RVA8_9PEZI|nr:hypothetical protein HII31_00418 [Pseudocercospora fuligena]